MKITIRKQSGDRYRCRFRRGREKGLAGIVGPKAKTMLLTGLGFRSMPSTNTGMTKNERSKLASELETNLGRRERRIRNPLNIFTQLLLREEKHVGKTAKEMIPGRLK